MQIKEVFDVSFGKYGRIIEDIDFSELVAVLDDTTPCGEDVIYVPEDSGLMDLAVKNELENRAFGGMPIQIGYCNGKNVKLNALEYHTSSEINVGTGPFILLLGKREDIGNDGRYDTSNVEAFLVPKGIAVEVYATSLHYAPVNVNGFKVAVVLPKGTNTDYKPEDPQSITDKLLFARNKWLIAHSEAEIDGAWCGLVGENITVDDDLR